MHNLKDLSFFFMNNTRDLQDERKGQMNPVCRFLLMNFHSVWSSNIDSEYIGPSSGVVLSFN